MSDQTQAQLRRLRWHCRRGLLELDLLLENFLQNHYLNLSHGQQASFTRFLESTDADLIAWLLHKHMPEDGEFVDLLKLINA